MNQMTLLASQIFSAPQRVLTRPRLVNPRISRAALCLTLYPLALLGTDISECGSLNFPGSYILVANLSSAGDCLIIRTSFVTIDLNGHTISRGNPVVDNPTNSTAVTVPPNYPPTRTANAVDPVPAPATRGISASGSLRDITIRNGMILGFSDTIDLRSASGVVVESTHLLALGQMPLRRSHAIAVGDGSQVRNNAILRNRGSEVAISAGENSVISGNTLEDMEGIGIEAGAGSAVTANVIRNISEDGINMAGDSIVSGNTVTGINDQGIRVHGRGIVSGNTVVGNGGGDGISVTGDNSSVSGNSVSSFRHGIVVGANSRVATNTVTGNIDGIQVNASGTIVENNHLAGNTNLGVRCPPGGAAAIKDNTFSANRATFAVCQDLGNNIF